MEKSIQLNEQQLRNVISKTIESALLAEGVDEVNWFKRAGNAVRNAYDNAKTAVGGAVAGAKAGLKYGGTTAASAGANDYKAKRNADLAASRKQEAAAAVREFRAEFDKRLKDLYAWKKSEVAQIKKMYGADAFASKANSAQAAAETARADRAQFNTNSGARNYGQVAESIDRIVNEELKKFIG
jgi:hypothetical protein